MMMYIWMDKQRYALRIPAGSSARMYIKFRNVK